jgi:hypothetical protein
MILDSKTVTADRFAAETGWEIKPEGACKGEVCIPLPESLAKAAAAGGDIDAAELAGAMNLPVAKAPEHGLMAIGPETIGARALTTATAQDIVLPDLDGNPFALSSLRGQKIVVYAWAPY